MVASLKFFLGKDEDEKQSDDSDSDEVDPKEVAMANKVNKKTRKREKILKKVKKEAAKNYKKKSAAPVFNFSALHLIHDPQGKLPVSFLEAQLYIILFFVILITNFI